MKGIWVKLSRQLKQWIEESTALFEKRPGLQPVISDLSLLVAIWGAKKQLLAGILLATFVVNVLSLAFPLSLLQVYDRVLPNTAINTLVFLLLGVAGALIVEVILKVARAYLSSWADAKFEFSIGHKSFQHVLESQLLEFEKKGAGVHLKRLGAVGMLRDFYSGQAMIAVVDTPFLILFFLLIAYIGNWVVLVPITILMIFIISMVSRVKNLQRFMERSQAHEDLRFSYIIETLGNIHTVKSMSMEAQMLRRYERLQKKSATYDHDISINNSSLATLTKDLSQAMIVAVVGVGSILVMDGRLTIGSLAACMLLSTRCMQPISTLVGMWARLKVVAIARNELQSLLRMPLETSSDLPAWGEIKGGITLKNVSFRYEKDTPWLFDNISLTVKPKEVISITGGGLSGKTTLMWLLLGMLSPDQGEILVDGKNIKQYQVNGLRQKIAYLPQKPILFNGTIMENITMFEVDKYKDRAKKSANFVGLHEVMDQLPQGYDTMVANRTSEALPRGVTQQIAMARAFLKEPPIVLFDEANSSIDLKGDKLIKQLLTRLVGRCTLIIVSHRPSIVELAEKHYRLKNGKLEVAV